MPHFYIYVRKSSESEERQILSIESQIKELKDLVIKRGLTVSEIFSESKSAKEPGRPVFNSLMKRVYEGQVKGIICWKLDRLARNPIDGASVIWAMKQQDLEIITPSQSYNYQSDNSFLMYVEFGMAQKYIDDLSKNVKRGLRAKIEKGWRPGSAPSGYFNDKYSEKGAKKIIKDPERFDLVRKMWDLMLTGIYTPPQVVDIANNQWGFRTRKTKHSGGKPLSKSNIYKLFANPFYCGLFKYKGEIHQGKHDPMVTIEEFERVQKMLGKNGLSKPKHRIFTLTGMIRCGECGCLVTAEEKEQLICSNCKFKFSRPNKSSCPKCGLAIEKMIKPKLLNYTYYHCTKRKTGYKCSQQSIKKEELEKQISQLLSELEIAPFFTEWGLRYSKKLCEKDPQNQKKINQNLKKALFQVQKRMDRLFDMKLNELISNEEFLEKKEELIKEQFRLREKIERQKNSFNQSNDQTGETLISSQKAKELFEKGTIEEKKLLFSAICSNPILKDKKLHSNLKKPFSIISKTIKEHPWLKSRLEPQKSGMVKGINPITIPKILIMRGLMDDIRTYWEKDVME